MQSKNKIKKTICTEIITESIIPIPAHVTAGIVGSSASMVKQVRQGKKNATGKMGQKIAIVDEILTDAINKSVDALTEIMHPDTNEIPNKPE